MTFHELLVIHASPTLKGLKAASLIATSHYGIEIPEDTGIEGLSMMRIPTRKETGLILIYRKEMLMECIASPDARRILEERGYDTGDISKSLLHLKQRFEEIDMPHEIGFFLGYPPNDVKGFIENNGKNAIASGMWKVYSDKENAERLLKLWNDAKALCMSLFSSACLFSDQEWIFQGL